MSHTLKVKVELKDIESLTRAIKTMGGTVIGQGSYELYSSTEEGFGFKLSGWEYPLIAKSDGTLAFDHYNGSWGNPKDIDVLKSAYAIAAATAAAEKQGWQYEYTSGLGLLIYHPDGGTLTVTGDGVVDADCFSGTGCENATEAIAELMGETTQSTHKREFHEDKVYAKEVE